MRLLLPGNLLIQLAQAGIRRLLRRPLIGRCAPLFLKKLLPQAAHQIHGRATAVHVRRLIPFPGNKECDIYFASMGEAAAKKCFALATQLRQGGICVECDTVGRGLKAQMKYADKLGAMYTVVVGDSELETGTAQLKDMKTGELTEITLDGSLYTVLYNKTLDRQLAGLMESVVE